MTNDQIFKGVATNKPDLFTRVAIEQSVNEFLIDKPDAKGGALLTVTTGNGINLVVVHKLNNKFFVKGWIGKKWNEPVEGGIGAVYYF